MQQGHFKAVSSKPQSFSAVHTDLVFILKKTTFHSQLQRVMLSDSCAIRLF